MAIPLSYSFRNLWTRKLTTILTASGMALVVFVFATVLMLAEGIKKTLVETGSADNVIVLRRSAEAEVPSAVERPQADIIESHAAIAKGLDGKPLISKETVVLIALPKHKDGKPSNIVIRGIGEKGFDLRPQVHLTKGRLFRPGTSEIITGSSIAKNFKGGGLGETVRFGTRDWIVVGVFDGGNTGFDSEIWGDVDQIRQAFKRPVYSSILFKLNNANDFAAVEKYIETDPRLNLEAKRESIFYTEQSQALSDFITILGISLSIIFSLGAIIGAMITMYASVANRIGEIGTLRALGFQRSDILLAFMSEALFLGAIGGIVGLGCASMMRFLSVSTMNFQTFAELAFTFTLNPTIVVSSSIFALLMGFVGGFLPALKASRMNIVDALRAA